MTETAAKEDGRDRGRRSALQVGLGLLFIPLTALVLFAMGREPICTCGYVKLWHGETVSAENSQHLADWYTFTHVLHGFLFYFLLWLVARRLAVGWRFVLAMLAEAGWEVIENSDWIIERYRTATISLDYFGDSIVNATADVAVTAAGFLLAARLPVWASILLFVALEVLLAAIIRDNLFLNVLMLVWPIDAVRRWQEGG